MYSTRQGLISYFSFLDWVGESYWLGLSDEVTEDDFQWEHDETASNFTAWVGYEPNGGANHNCVVSRPSWNDQRCTTLGMVICEFWLSKVNGILMMTSSNGNIFRVTGPLCGSSPFTDEFSTQWAVTRSTDVFFDLRLNNDWVNNSEAGEKS